VLSEKSSYDTSQTFLQQVLSRFGACAKCLTDQGFKFKGEFQDLLDHALIDHHRTLKDHPQADGLVEKMVQTCKKRLRKMCDSPRTNRIRTWPYFTSPWVTRCPNTPLCLISLLTFYFLASHSNLFHCCSNGPGCGLGLPNHLG